MKRFILLALAAFGFYSCTDSIDSGDVQNCGNVRNIAYESFNYCGQLKENPSYQNLEHRLDGYFCAKDIVLKNY